MEDERTGSLRVAVGRIVLRVVAVLAFYILSIGPVVRLADFNRSTGTDQIIVWFYYPVFWVREHSQPLGVAIQSYIDFWQPKGTFD